MNEIKDLSFEEGMKELEQIVRRLESGQVSLEQSIEDYKRGSALKEHCEKKLASAKLIVEKIVKNPDGSVNKEPMDVALTESN